MLCISLALITVFCIIAAFADMVFGVMLFKNLMAAGQKTNAEIVLFAAIFCALILMTVYIKMLTSGKKTGHELERILSRAQAGNKINPDLFDKFGLMGKSLRNFFVQTEKIGEKRAQRISFLNAALLAFMEKSKQAAVLLDPTGSLLAASPDYLEKFWTQEIAAYGATIGQLHKEINFEQIWNKIISTHAEEIVQAEKFTATFVPIGASEENAAGAMVFFKKNSIISQTASAIKKTSEEYQNSEEAKELKKQLGEKVRQTLDSGDKKSLGRRILKLLSGK